VLEREEAFACSRAKPTDHVFASEAGTPLGFRNIVWHDLRNCYASVRVRLRSTGP